MADATKITVVLERGVSKEFADDLATAIEKMRGVEVVTVGEVTSDFVLAKLQVTSHLRSSLHQAVEQVLNLEGARPPR